MANLKTDPNKRHYFAEVQPEEYAEIMKKVMEDKVEILAWEQGKSGSDVEKYLAKSYEKGEGLITLETAGGLLSKLSSSKLVDKEIFIKIGSGKFQFFTTSLFTQNPETKAYELKLNRSVYKTMQRQNYRLQANPNIKIQFRVDDDSLYDCLDISAGGTAFIVSEEEAERYQKGAVFSECKLGMNKAKFEIPTAKVAGAWPVKDTEGEPTGEMKVGIAFENVSNDTEEAMFQAINGEARAEEMRKIMLEKKASKSRESGS